MRPLRIGIACYPTYGGSGVLATELGLALARHGHEVHIFSYARPSRLGHYQRGVHFHGVSVSSYPLFRYPPYDLALASVMRQVMAERDLDILHVHYAVPHALCAFLAREMCSRCETRIVTTLHGTDITILGRDPAYRDVICFGLGRSDAVISVSRWLAGQTREAFAYDGPVRVLPNFVNAEVFHPRRDDRLRRQLGGDDHFLIVHMSNFRPLKRTTDTVEILRKLPDDLPARLVLAGDGPDLGAVQDLATRYGVADRVDVLGEIDDVGSVVAAADVAVFPSESESFGLAMLEAMACGLPVVTTNIGGLPEVVESGRTGFLHEVGDTDSMAADVAELLRDPERRRRMGGAGRRRATERFSLDTSLRQHETLYRDLLRGVAPRDDFPRVGATSSQACSLPEHHSGNEIP